MRAILLMFWNDGFNGNVELRFSSSTMLFWAASSVRGTLDAVNASESILSGI